MASYDDLWQYINLVEDALQRERALAESIKMTPDKTQRWAGDRKNDNSSVDNVRIMCTDSQRSESDSNPLNVPTDESRSVNGRSNSPQYHESYAKFSNASSSSETLSGAKYHSLFPLGKDEWKRYAAEGGSLLESSYFYRDEVRPTEITNEHENNIIRDSILDCVHALTFGELNKKQTTRSPNNSVTDESTNNNGLQSVTDESMASKRMGLAMINETEDMWCRTVSPTRVMDGSYYVVSQHTETGNFSPTTWKTIPNGDTAGFDADLESNNNSEGDTVESNSPCGTFVDPFKRLNSSEDESGHNIVDSILSRSLMSQAALSEMFGEDEFCEKEVRTDDTGGMGCSSRDNKFDRSPESKMRSNAWNCLEENSLRKRAIRKALRLLSRVTAVSVVQLSSLLWFWATEKLFVDPEITLRDMFLTNGSLNHTISLERLYDSILNSMRVLALNLPHNSMIEMLLDVDRPGN